MSGYCSDFSMSNNAVEAYERGLVPASKIPGVPAALVREFCGYSEWHHSSKMYNKVLFYDPHYVRVTFGLEEADDDDIDDDGEKLAADPSAVAALANYVPPSKTAGITYKNCVVKWVEWRGSWRHPKAKNREESGCTVLVKGQTATITLPDGKSFQKRVDANGFEFRKYT